MNDKFDELLDLIKEVDGKRIKSPLSEYETIYDMKQYANRRRLSAKQLNLMSRIKRKYQKKRENPW